MKLLFMLNYLNNKFLNSSKKIKIELYILPLLIFAFLYFFFLENSIKEESQLLPKIDFSEYDNKNFNGSFSELFSILEKLASKNKVLILTNNRVEKQILLKGKAKKESILEFIKEIENINNFTKIDSLVFTKDEVNDFEFNLKIDLNNFYIKDLKNKKNKNFDEVKKDKKIEFKINAIISKYALINEKWIKENEKIENFILVKIEKNSVLLKNEFEEIKFSPNVESNSKIKNVLFKDDIFDCNLFLFKFFKKTGDFLIVRKDCAPSLHDELLYRSIIEYSFPEKRKSIKKRYLNLNKPLIQQ